MTSRANDVAQTPVTKQDTLVSGVNIHTINGASILGAGDITVVTDVAASINAAAAKATPVDADQLGIVDSAASNVLKKTTWAQIKTALASVFQAVLVSGTNLRTVNGNTLLGSTDVTVQGTLVSGTNIKTVNGASLLGSGDVVTSSSSVAWTTKTANYTAVAGDTIRANTTGGTFTITLPAAPNDNDAVSWKDYAGTFGTNKLTFGRNGKNIMGLAEDMDVTTKNFSGELTFIAATNDWRF